MKRFAIIASLLLFACSGETEPSTDNMSFMLDHADDYLNNAEFRREALETSLWKPELPYARKRLAGYALPSGGWDGLHEITGLVETVGESPSQQNLIPDETPKTEQAWLELGERVFWSMPMRRDSYLEWLIDRPELWSTVGLQTDDSGQLRGIVRFTDNRGEQRAGATCGLCHGDRGTAGQPTRGLDLGRGRAMFLDAHDIDGSIYESWGSGRVDVTDDDVADAIAIPHLFGIDSQTHLNASGAIELTSPAVLAVRFETQYIVGHSLEVRPNRVLTWALAMYVLSLSSPVLDNDADGREVFDAHCATCHVPSNHYAGSLVPVDQLHSDPQVAQSVLRGTGFYKTPSLIGVSDRGPYLHDGSVKTLKELLNSHLQGLELDETEQTKLLNFLGTL